MPIISTVGGSGAVSGVTVTGTAASGQVPVASSASAGAWAYPPGFEIAYAQVTTPTNITDTAENTGTSLISPGAVVFDGTAVLCEFFALVRTGSAAQAVTVSLFEGATQITELAIISLAAAAQDVFPVDAKYRFTPTAASHTYSITAFVSSTTGTPRFNAGTGGTAGFPPAFVRFTKV